MISTFQLGGLGRVNVAPGFNFSRVSWLLHGNGTDASTVITDSSSYARATTANGNAQIDTSQFKFGGASIQFDGAGDTVSAAASSDFDFGAGDWTIEAWMRWTTTGQDWGLFRTTDNRFVFKGDNNRFVLQISGTNRWVVGFVPTLNQWYHIACCRAGTTTRLFVDGTLYTSAASENVTSHTNTAPIVGEADGSRFMNGWIDDLRVIKGFGLYTNNFTPPTAQLPGGASVVGPLDSYTTNLWSAVSINRLLSSWTGPSVQVRRSSDSTLQNVGFDTTGSLDTASLLSFVGAGDGFVATAINQQGVSAQGYTASTDARQPRVALAGLFDGFMRFDGTDDLLASGSNSGTPTGFTVFVRGTLRVTTGVQVMAEHSVVWSSNDGAVSYVDAGVLILGVRDTSPTGTSRSDFSGLAPNNNVHCWRYDRSATGGANQAVCFVNGTKQTRSANADVAVEPSGSFGSYPWYIGSRFGAAFPATLNLHTLLIYESALSDADCTAISNIIRALGSPAAAGHRYWRFSNFTGTTVSFFETTEITVLEGATNRAAGIAPTASSSPLNGALVNLTNGGPLNESPSQYWSTAVANTLRLTWDLGSNYLINGFQVARYDTAGRVPTSVTVERSDNGTSWTIVGTYTITEPGTNYTLSAVVPFP